MWEAKTKREWDVGGGGGDEDLRGARTIRQREEEEGSKMYKKNSRLDTRRSLEPGYPNHILKMPNLLFSLPSPPCLPEDRAAFNPCPSTRLVCAGGMMPSSHSLADENTASLSLSILSCSSGSTVLPTASITADNCCEPITPILAFGHIQRKRGE